MVLRSKEDGWAMLAEAIIESGIRANDTAFLKSRWCQELKDIVQLNAQLHGCEEGYAVAKSPKNIQ